MCRISIAISQLCNIVRERFRLADNEHTQRLLFLLQNYLSTLCNLHCTYHCHNSCFQEPIVLDPIPHRVYIFSFLDQYFDLIDEEFEGEYYVALSLFWIEISRLYHIIFNTRFISIDTPDEGFVDDFDSDGEN